MTESTNDLEAYSLHVDPGRASSTSDLEAFSLHVNPGRASLLQQFYGRVPSIAAVDGVRFQDASNGRWYLNCHSNGGVFNLGHRPEPIRHALLQAIETADVGNSWLPSEWKGRLARRLTATTEGLLDGVFFATSGGEAIDIAIKVARGATRRPEVVSIEGGYHGHTGLATATGTDDFQRPWHYQLPDFRRVPWNDLDALDAAITDRTALVLLETIPATLGMPMPAPGYLAAAQTLANRKGALLALDEVQAGLGRTGMTWGYQHEGVEPDLVITGKGLGGGLYPMSATLVRAGLLEVLREHPFAQFATFAGSNLGCAVSSAVLDELERPGFLDRVNEVAAALSTGLASIGVEIRQRGMMIGIATGHPGGGVRLARLLLDHGVWTVPAGNDPSVLQLLPPLVINDADVELLITAVTEAASSLINSTGVEVPS